MQMRKTFERARLCASTSRKWLICLFGSLSVFIRSTFLVVETVIEERLGKSSMRTSASRGSGGPSRPEELPATNRRHGTIAKRSTVTFNVQPPLHRNGTLSSYSNQVLSCMAFPLSASLPFRQGHHHHDIPFPTITHRYALRC